MLPERQVRHYSGPDLHLALKTLAFSTEKLKISASAASFVLASLLAFLKISQSGASNSVGILASGADSLLDALAALILLAAISGSTRPADAEHRYGHGKYEALAGLLRALFVEVSALVVCYRALEKISSQQGVAEVEAGSAVMVASLLATAAIFAFQSYVARKTDSIAIAADRLNYLGDLGSGSFILLGFLLEGSFAIQGADVLGGVLLAFYIAYSGFQILRESLAHLLDQDISERFIPEIRKFIASQSEDVRGFHNVRSRRAGDRHFLELHLELKSDISFRRSHQLVEELSARLLAAHSSLEVIIHAEPAAD